MNKNTKKGLDLVIPSMGAIGTAFYFITRKDDRDVKFLILIIALVFVLLYAVTTQVTKAIIIAGEKPEDVKGTGDTSSAINSTTGAKTGFDADGWADRVKRDVYAPFWGVSVRDADLYEKMVLFGNDDLINMWNAWKKKYFEEHGETMTEAIDAEFIVPFSAVATNRDKIVKRLKTLGCR